MYNYICLAVIVIASAQAQFGNNQFGQNVFGRRINQHPNEFQQQNAFVQSTARTHIQWNAPQWAFQSQKQQVASAGNCRELNERQPVPASCDRYIECINGTAEEKMCPDGLRFNPNVNFNVNPCQYPNEVPCPEGSSLQPPQPTADCPNQFGFFKLGDAQHCSSWRSCVDGVAYDFSCPEGLAFSSESYRCEWPDEVADCDAEAFLGFRCPEVPVSGEFGSPANYRFYRSDNNCQKYFLCIEGRPRVLTCGGDSAFDDLTNTCVSADEVSACPAELRAHAKMAREEEMQRLAIQLELEAISSLQQKRRL